MRRHSRVTPDLRSIALAQLPGAVAAARSHNVYVDRREGETVSGLMEGICLAGMEALPGQNVGCCDGGAEIHLHSGAVLSCVGTGQSTPSFRRAVTIFAAKSARLVAEFDAGGRLELSDGWVLSDSDASFYVY